MLDALCKLKELNEEADPVAFLMNKSDRDLEILDIDLEFGFNMLKRSEKKRIRRQFESYRYLLSLVKKYFS